VQLAGCRAPKVERVVLEVRGAAGRGRVLRADRPAQLRTDAPAWPSNNRSMEQMDLLWCIPLAGWHGSASMGRAQQLRHSAAPARARQGACGVQACGDSSSL